MSLKKPVAMLTMLCALCAVNMFALAQDKDTKPGEPSSQATVKATPTATTPAPADSPSNGNGTPTLTPDAFDTPGIQRRASAQTRSSGQNVQEAMKKAEEEMQKVQLQLDKTLQDLEKNTDQTVILKAREEMRKALQKSYEAMEKAKAQYDKTVKEFKSIPVLPGTGMDPFMFGRGGGMGGGGYGISGGRGIRQFFFDNRTGQPIMGGSNPWEPSNDPEARALQEKEQNIEAEVQRIVEQYNSSPDKDERAKLKKRLEELSGEQFDIRQQYREMQVKRLETELARIRESIQKRNENREQIIKRHIAQLLNEEDGLEF